MLIDQNRSVWGIVVFDFFLQIAFTNADVGKGWTNVFFLVDFVFVGFHLWLFCAATGSGIVE